MFLDCLNSGKDYYKPVQFALKPSTENDIFSLSLHHFRKNIFSGALSRK